MPEELKSVLDIVVKVVKYVKAQPMNSRLLSVLCGEMGSEHAQLLLHTEVRWLLRGKVLTRLFELHSEVSHLTLSPESPQTSTLVNLFHDPQWLAKLARRADIFSMSSTWDYRESV